MILLTFPSFSGTQTGTMSLYVPDGTLLNIFFKYPEYIELKKEALQDVRHWMAEE